MIHSKIVNIDVQDIRFPTSLWGVGSNVTCMKPNHSCVYVTIKTDSRYIGYGLTSTLGKGNELVVKACKLLSEIVMNQTTTEIYANFASFWRKLTSGSQFKWLGPDCGVIHLAAAAIVNALWDLWARIENKPVWKLLTDMTPEQLVSTIDFRYMRDYINEEQAIQLLKKGEPYKEQREKTLREKGYPAHTADFGWLVYKSRAIRDRSKKYARLEFDMFKMPVTQTNTDTVSRCYVMRNTVGWKRKLVLDGSQLWGEEDNKSFYKLIKNTRPFCIEEPTSPDDFIMHSIMHSDLVKNHRVSVSIGETCANRVVFKQFLSACAFNFWNMNVARLGGINEALAIYFMAIKSKRPVPIWGYTGGIGLGEMVQHLQMWDYICLSQTTENRSIEFVNHQHGYFENPTFIRNAHYMLPTSPGLSTKLKDKCIARWAYPKGTRWTHLFKTKPKHFVNEIESDEESERCETESFEEKSCSTEEKPDSCEEEFYLELCQEGIYLREESDPEEDSDIWEDSLDNPYTEVPLLHEEEPGTHEG